MADFNVRSDSVDVEQIMRQIRARIREKRGADYTEAELQQLAKVKLEKFLDPRGVRSDLVEQFRKREHTPSPPLPKLELKDFSIYGTHRGLLKSIRSLLQPILKLFVNPNPLIHFVWTQAHAQAEINEEINRWMRKREAHDAKMDPLYYELLHNLVIELTRVGIEVHNLKMRVESLSSRIDFDERRGRSLERVVEYRPGAVQRPAASHMANPPVQVAPPPTGRPEGPRPDGPRQDGPRQDGQRQEGQRQEGQRQDGQRQDGPRPEGEGGGRRRRRRRRRRPGGNMGTPGASGTPGTPDTPGTDGARGPREDSESANAAARANGGGAPFAENDDDGPDDGPDDEAAGQ